MDDTAAVAELDRLWNQIKQFRRTRERLETILETIKADELESVAAFALAVKNYRAGTAPADG